MARTCKNLEVLVIGCVRVESWPKLSETLAWTSLKQLSLLNVEMNADLSGVGMHHIMPNLEVFCISVADDCDEDSPMTLPEFENCKNLRQISLRCEAFTIIKSLPSSLEYIDGCCFLPDSCWESLKKRYGNSPKFTMKWTWPGMENNLDWLDYAPEWGDPAEDEDYSAEDEAPMDDQEEEDYDDFELFEVDEVRKLKEDAKRPLSPSLLLHRMELDKGSDEEEKEDYYDGAMELEASMQIFSSIDRKK